MRCPKCNTENSVIISVGLVVKPIGTFSLAGAQLKSSAFETAIAECGNCDLRVQGHLEGATASADGKTFTGGHFVVNAAT